MRYARRMSTRPGLAVLAAALVVALCAGRAVAEDASPVLVVAHGPKAVLVEIAAGEAMPCDSSANHMLYRGWLLPGEARELSSAVASVCFRQTYDNFSEANWSTPRLLRPLPLCSALRRRVGPCTPVPDRTIRVEVSSPEPRG